MPEQRLPFPLKPALVKLSPALLAASVATACSSVAMAQTVSSDSEELSTVTVVGDAATKTKTPFNETPQATSVVSAEDIEQRGAETVQRALDYTPGAFTNQIGSSNRYDYIVLRGFSDGSVGNTFLDGLKVMGDTSAYSSLSIDPYFLESIEVVKGPASVLYGRASPGGVVALSRKRPTFDDSGEIQLGFGNNAQREAAFDVNGTLDEEKRVAWRVTGKGRAADTQFDHVEEEGYFIAPQLAWDITDATTLNLYAYLSREPEGAYHAGLPYEGTVKSHAGRHIDNTFFEGEDDYDNFERNQVLLGYELEHRFSDGLTARQNLRYLEADVELDQVYASGWANDTELYRGYSGADESLKAWTVDNQLEANFATGELQHRVLAGLDYQYRDNDVSWSYGTFPTIDAYNPSYGAGPVGDLVVYEEGHHKLEQTGVYLQDQLQWDRWHLAIGGRYDWVSIDNNNRIADTTSSLDDTQFSGRVGLLYAFDNGVSPFANYTTSFSPTSQADANGDLLDPMEGAQMEAGVKYQPTGTQDQYSLALFHITQENVATKQPDELYFHAVGEIESQGVELEAQTQLTDSFRLHAGYAFTDATYSKSDNPSEEGNEIIASPRHIASLWGYYEAQDGPLAGLNTGLGVRYHADIQADRANTEKVPDYTLVDATLGYDFSHVGLKGVSARLNVNNLLDKDYVASCYDLNYCYFGAERSVEATVSYQW
ncbi:TonB-dependent siderophore receptor [Halomonas binhaiensis]|uniref:TonB-dependent siderophore receptor n=1 Tax=Halomonas binhaiensis TaxID=2562282 RepID=A0A5C1NJB3_9GAMM|nr:TonB-dependent siderophore receptor [Halomonas binhaiensis]QEM82733.1 TonB-dependent siderophore receptor [Halomonas binhaiensis]